MAEAAGRSRRRPVSSSDRPGRRRAAPRARAAPAGPGEPRKRRRLRRRPGAGRPSTALGAARRRLASASTRASGRHAVRTQLLTYSGDTRAGSPGRAGRGRPGEHAAVVADDHGGTESSCGRGLDAGRRARRRRARCRPRAPTGRRTASGRGRPRSRASSSFCPQPPTLGGSKGIWPSPARTAEQAAGRACRPRSAVTPSARSAPTTYSTGCLTSPVSVAVETKSGWATIALEQVGHVAVGRVAGGQVRRPPGSAGVTG